MLKKCFMTFIIIFGLIIPLAVNIPLLWGDGPAPDESSMFISSSPDVLIILDESGSMSQSPAGDSYIYGADTSCAANTTKCYNPADPNYTYFHDATCTPDLVNCDGSNDATHTYIYGADLNCTANVTAGACIGTGSTTYKYAYDKSCKANTTYCTGTGCSGGFCSTTAHSNCTTDCSNAVGKYGYCSGGFCGVSKTGCSTMCDCKNGMCKSSINNCTTQCATNKCQNGFCNDTAQTDCVTDCSKIVIAKRALFNILDDDNNGTINSADSDSLGVRIGFMRFRNGDDTGGSWSSGNNKLISPISAMGAINGTPYSTTFCNNSTSCTLSSINNSTDSFCGGTESISCQTAVGGTPLASALKEAKSYLDAHYAQDPYGACRQKFAIFISDGADTYVCGGNGQECQQNMYARRREVVAAARALAIDNIGPYPYKTYVVGFGSAMPDYQKNTLEWAAYYGGTDNPDETKSGDKTAYNIGANATFPSGISSCQNDASEIAAMCGGSSTSQFEATNNDPGYLPLGGYAFFADDAEALSLALKKAFISIAQSTYSFSQTSIQAVRTNDENYAYTGSFVPAKNDPFWIGHLQRYDMDSSGNPATTTTWDAGAVLAATTGASRNIYTLNNAGTSLMTFTTSNLTNQNLNVSTDADRTLIVNFVRGGELDPDYVYYGWKLGDIFHSSPMAVGTPNSYFVDVIDQTNPSGYSQFHDAHIRSSANGKRLIIAGANDGQLHAFKTGEIGAGGGVELWSFVPPNLLSLLSNIGSSHKPESHVLCGWAAEWRRSLVWIKSGSERPG